MADNSLPEHNPFQNQPEICEAAKEFSAEVLGYLDDASEGSFLDTLQKIAPYHVSLRGIHLSSPALNPQVRSLLTQLPLSEYGDDLCAELNYTQLVSGEIILDQLGITLDDSTNRVVLSRAADDIVTLTDYEATGSGRKAIGPISLMEDTLLSMLSKEIPDDLSNEQWQSVVRYLEGRAVTSERVFDLERKCDDKVVELRIIESELEKSSSRAIEIGVFTEKDGIRKGIRMHLAELGTTAEITARGSNVTAMKPFVDDDTLHYASAFEAFSNGVTSRLNPNEADVAMLEVNLENIFTLLAQEAKK